MGFPGSASGNEPTCQCRHARKMGSIPGLGRSPGVGNGNPLQYSCLENPMDRVAWRAIVHGVAKSQAQLSPQGLPSLEQEQSAARMLWVGSQRREKEDTPDPAESRGAPPPPQDPSPLRGTLGSSLRSPAEGEGSPPHLRPIGMQLYLMLLEGGA